LKWKKMLFFAVDVILFELLKQHLFPWFNNQQNKFVCSSL
jgi:hypothetical protein